MLQLSYFTCRNCGEEYEENILQVCESYDSGFCCTDCMFEYEDNQIKKLKSKTIKEYCEICSEIAKEKGFDVTQTPEQLLLMASEVSEALENIDIEINSHVFDYCNKFKEHILDFEKYRKSGDYIRSTFKIKENNNIGEELADIIIRVFSYCGGNNIDLESEINKKIEYNKQRPHLHGKKF